MRLTAILKTQRLDLRPLTDSDYPAYKRLVTNPVIAQPVGFSPRPDDQQVRRWYRADRNSAQSYAVVLHQTNQFIGAVIFYDWFADNGLPDETSLELGYFLDPEYWGRGLMPEGLTACFRDLNRVESPIKSVWANCLVSNERSCQLLEKLCFQTIGDQLMGVTGGGQTLQRQALFRLNLGDSQNN